MGKYKCYVVWVGRCPGVYYTWDDCYAQVNGFPGARYKGFVSIDEAKDAFRAIAACSTSSVTFPRGLMDRGTEDPSPRIHLHPRATPIVMHQPTIIVILFIIILFLFVILLGVFVIVVRGH